jgi:hypothetical protein
MNTTNTTNIRDKIWQWLPEGLTALLGTLPTIAVSLSSALGLDKAVKNLSPLPFVKLSLFLLSLVIWLLAYWPSIPQREKAPEPANEADGFATRLFAPLAESRMRGHEDTLLHRSRD